MVETIDFSCRLSFTEAALLASSRSFRLRDVSPVPSGDDFPDVVTMLVLRCRPADSSFLDIVREFGGGRGTSSVRSLLKSFFEAVWHIRKLIY